MYRRTGVFVLFIFLTCSWKAYGEGQIKFSDPNIENALVTFYGVFFNLKDYCPTDFYNTEDPKRRYTINEFLLNSSDLLGDLIRQSIESLSTEITSKDYFLVHFSVPGGKVYYACHSHLYPFKATDNHCTACIKDGSIEAISVRLSSVDPSCLEGASPNGTQEDSNLISAIPVNFNCSSFE